MTRSNTENRRTRRGRTPVDPGPAEDTATHVGGPTNGGGETPSSIVAGTGLEEDLSAAAQSDGHEGSAPNGAAGNGIYSEHEHVVEEVPPHEKWRAHPESIGERVALAMHTGATLERDLHCPVTFSTPDDVYYVGTVPTHLQPLFCLLSQVADELRQKALELERYKKGLDAARDLFYASLNGHIHHIDDTDTTKTVDAIGVAEDWQVYAKCTDVPDPRREGPDLANLMEKLFESRFGSSRKPRRGSPFGGGDDGIAEALVAAIMGGAGGPGGPGFRIMDLDDLMGADGPFGGRGRSPFDRPGPFGGGRD